MFITDLSQVLLPKLKVAQEVWIACALIRDDGYDQVISILDEGCKVHWLIGIDLPTSPTVLRKIKHTTLAGQHHARLYKSEKTFHPKVYLIKSSDNLTAYLGSANLTGSGLSANIEAGYEIVSQEDCGQILSWFNILYSQGYSLTDENVKAYELNFDAAKINQDASTAAIKTVVLKNETIRNSPLDHYDFTTRFFKREHHEAFRRELWLDESILANKERNEAQKQFLELHKMIYPLFPQSGLKELFPNVANHIVSMSYHFPGQAKQNLDAMWLSYGKSQREIKKYRSLFPKATRFDDERDLQSFINHSRLQVRIDLTEIGIWILFGKNNNGSIFDRDYFKKKMEERVYREQIFWQLLQLPKEYWIQINRIRKNAHDFLSANNLHTFCKTDNLREYFIIGRDYTIGDENMSENKLPTTVIQEFQRLYTLYDLMKHRF